MKRAGGGGARERGAAFVDHAKVLGLTLDEVDDAAAVTRAYRRMARKYHPDKSKAEDAPLRFQMVQEAYQTLSQEKLRANFVAKAKARARREAELEHLSLKRRRMKQVLEEREGRNVGGSGSFGGGGARGAAGGAAVKTMEKTVAALRAEMGRMREHVAAKRSKDLGSQGNVNGANRETMLKVDWKRSTFKFRMTAERLESIFSSFGELSAVALGRNGKSAVIEFKDAAAAATACLDGDSRLPSGLRINYLRKQTPGGGADAHGSHADPRNDAVMESLGRYEAAILRKLRIAGGLGD